MTTSITIVLVGGVITIAIVIRAVFENAGIPPLVGYFGVGIALRYLDIQWGLLGATGTETFEFLAALGIFALLFRIGLESRVAELIKRLPDASLIWVGDVAVNLAFGYVAARYLIGWEAVPSLFVAIALTATSVGVSATVWREAKRIDSPQGALMLDVAELDDVSGVVLMALLFAVAPSLQMHPDAAVGPLVAETLGLFVIKLAVFGAACVLFSQYAEERVTAFFQHKYSGEGTMLLVVGFSLIVTAMADVIGFSLAIGAFFAGLIFSRDPQSVRLDASFASIHDLLVPFFFVGIGLQMDPSALTGDVGAFLVLIGVALAGKLIGAGGPAWGRLGLQGGVLLGVTMWPRAEISLIVMQRGLVLGDWAVTPASFASMVVVSACTVLITPLLLRALFDRWPSVVQPASQ